MLIPIKYLSKILTLKPTGVVHVGAHQAEELSQYREFGWGNIIWVEAIESNVKVVSQKIKGSDDICIQALVWSKSGIEKEFHISNNGQSSSVFEFGSHSKFYPDIKFTASLNMTTMRLDEILPTDFQFDFLNLDIQGAELEAILGLGKNLDKINFIYTEVNKADTYVNCAKVREIDEYLSDQGFKRVLTFWTHAGWGDALYVRKSKMVRTFKRAVYLMKIIIFFKRLPVVTWHFVNLKKLTSAAVRQKSQPQP